jgi:DNA-binding transcriptional ArsR family regulator
MSESQVLAALAHPLRRRLIEVLRAHGPATVGALAAHTGHAAGNVSHHMRVLGAAGLAEEAPELARDRRERWWRHPTPPAANALDQHVRRVRDWETAGDAERRSWGGAPFAKDRWLRLTPDELAALGAELDELLDRWARRATAPDDARRPVCVLAHGVPARP